jgi:hypothetical protein
MTKNLNEALFKLQGVLRGVKKDSANPHFKNRYASLEQVTDTIRPHMQELGLYWMQMPGLIRDGSIEVMTKIVHTESGEDVHFVMEMPLAKRDPQGAGSAMTYAMRYSLMAALGLPPTDDDAETAIDRNETRPVVDETPKSSSQLKKDGSWDKVVSKLAEDMLDVHTFGQFEMLKADYRELAVKERWNKTFMEQLKEVFYDYELALTKKIDDENALQSNLSVG